MNTQIYKKLKYKTNVGSGECVKITYSLQKIKLLQGFIKNRNNLFVESVDYFVNYNTF